MLHKFNYRHVYRVLTNSHLVLFSPAVTSAKQKKTKKTIQQQQQQQKNTTYVYKPVNT